jgi:poly-beta-1,6-N-acetyl-D-glucosamine biosynthesis protein PgaD
MSEPSWIIDERSRLPRWYRWRDRALTAVAWIAFLSMFDVIPLFVADLVAFLGKAAGYDAGFQSRAGEHVQLSWAEIRHLLHLAGWVVGVLATFGLYNLYLLVAMHRERHVEPAEPTRDAERLGVDPTLVATLRGESIVSVGFDATGHIASLRAGPPQRSNV